jgi:two-component system cell cycle sensor histidine kinase/response regulator CckA
LTHPGDVASMRSLYRTHMERGTASLTYEKRYLRPDGRTIWARASVSQRKDHTGRLCGYLGVVEDITARKTAAEALERQTELLQSIMDNLPVMIAMYGKDSRPVFLNREWERKLGWTLAEADGVDLVGAIFPDHAVRGRVATLARTGTSMWTDLEPRARDGNVIPSAWACIGLSDGTRLTIGKDNSERRAMEQRLVQSQRMGALGQLAGGVAHDFNNILTVITACAAFIKDASIERSDVLEDLKQIEEACRRAEALTRQLLAFSRRQMLKPEIVDVNLALKNLSRTLRRLIGEQIELALVPSAAPATVEVDAYQLEQVILNLSVNARDAIRENGTITIDTKNVRRSAAGSGGAERDYLVVSVSDDGEGIPANVRDRIFEPFFTTKAVGKGTGLGLATVLGIVEQSGGFVEVDSAVGVGTTFRVFLPSVDAVPIRLGDHEAIEDLRGTETVLLVEDEATVRGIARRVLASLGYTVLEARHGADALSVSREHAETIDVLVTDVVMPEMGGRELAKTIRLDRPALPVLYVSGYTDDELLRRGILEDGARLLRKPFLPLELAKAIRTLIAARQGRP